MPSDIDMLIVLMSDLVELHLSSSDPEERGLLVERTQLAVQVGDQGGDQAQVHTQEGVAGDVLPSKVVFLRRSSSIKGCLPSKVIFH